MATYSTVKKGSSGEEVKELQTILNNRGYSLDVDGVFGSKTQAAVRDYQQKNNLSVDGVVGKNTWNSLNSTPDVLFGDADIMFEPNFGGQTQGNQQMSAADWLAMYEGSRPQYEQSQSVTDAYNMLMAYQNARPGAYQSRYEAQIQGLLNQILNREKFSYDFASDPMYQQYADRYQQQGKMAMMDTMANAAALSGGYANSYAQSVGQQAYQGYMQGLNDIIPELRDAAYQMYQDEGDAMYSQIDLLRDMDNTEYSRHRDSVSDYNSGLSYYSGMYNNALNMDYNKYLDSVDAWESDRDYYYGKYMDEQAMAAADAKKSSSERRSSDSKKTDISGDVEELVRLGAVDQALNLIDQAASSGAIDESTAYGLLDNYGIVVGSIDDNGRSVGAVSTQSWNKDKIVDTDYGKNTVNLSENQFNMLKAQGNAGAAAFDSYDDYKRKYGLK